jgi:hypothetical protein
MLLITLTTFPGAHVLSQHFGVEVGTNSGFAYNVFHSPVSFLTEDGALLDRNELISSGAFTELHWDLSYKPALKHKKHRLFLDQKGYYRDFYNSRNHLAKEFSFDAGASHYYRLSGSSKISNRLSVSRERKLGLDVFGDALLNSFSYYKLDWAASFRHAFSKRKKIEAFIGHERKLYDRLNDEETLTYYESTIGIAYDHRFRGTKSILSLSADYRDRHYTERSNFQLLNPNRSSEDTDPFLPFDPMLDYPTWIWRYTTVAVIFKTRLPGKITLRPSLTFKNRYDGASGDFTYKQIEYALVAIKRIKKSTLDIDVSFSDRDFRDRLAQQESGGPYPTLTFQYVRANATVNFSFSKKLKMELGTNYLGRFSNTTAITERTRRDYHYYEIKAGIHYAFKGEFKDRYDWHRTNFKKNY